MRHRFDDEEELGHDEFADAPEAADIDIRTQAFAAVEAIKARSRYGHDPQVAWLPDGRMVCGRCLHLSTECLCKRPDHRAGLEALQALRDRWAAENPEKHAAHEALRARALRNTSPI